MSVPNTFASATTSIPLANLDANFAYYDAAFAISGSAVTFAGSITLTTGTANGVPYLNASKVLTSGAVLTFDGTTLSSTKFAGALNGTVGATTPSTGVFTSLNSSGIITISIPGTGIPTNLAVNTTAGAANGMSIETRADESSGIRLVQTSTTYNTSPVSASDPPNIASAGTLVSGRGGGLNIVGANGPVRTYSGGAGTATTSVSSTGLAVTGTLSATGNATLSGATAEIQFTGATYGWLRSTVGDLYIDAPSAKSIFLRNAGTTIGTVSSTGLAVTGTLSSTLDATIQGVTVGRGAGAVSTNTAVGAGALAANTTGSFSTAIGAGALAAQTGTAGVQNLAVGNDAAGKLTTGTQNTAVGISALGWGASVATTGTFNATFGQASLYLLTSGSYNTSLGAQALYSNTTASNNTAVGYQAGYTNSTGERSTAIGHSALYSATVSDNTAIGYFSGYLISTGQYNLAVGGGDGASGSTLSNNTTGSNNTALGFQSLRSNTTASNNTAVGYQAGYSNTTNGACTFIGQSAGYNSTGSTNNFIGNVAGYYVTTGAKNTIIGSYNGNQGGLDIRTASNYIVLSDGDGNPRVISSSSEFFITTMGSGAGTNALKFNTATGAVTYDTSSARYKDNIRDSIYGLSHVMQMRSAQFEYKDTGRSDVGLIAEELDPIIPELVGKNKDGQPDSVSYDRMVSVLVKAIQELKAEVDSLKLQLKGA